MMRSGFVDPGPDPRRPRAITRHEFRVRAPIPERIRPDAPRSGAWGQSMSQAVWTGSISFGLVSIPVKLYPATEPKDVRFHLYDRRTGKRLHYERVTKDIDAPAFEPEPYSDDGSEERPEPRIADDIGPAVPAAQ